jgi:monofunctional biosynthetic peptidoglycan transglycosylase
VTKRIFRGGKKVLKKTGKWIKRGAAILCAGFLASILVYFFYPDVTRLKMQNPKTTAFMEQRKGEWEEKGKKIKIKHRWVPLSRVSPYVTKAVIIAEDDKFWSHEGFDFEAIQKAIEKDLKKKRFKAGGSTISQQLSKNLYLSPSKNPVRKLKEAILTWRLEKALSKRRIIELYVNLVEWGEGIFGIEAASQHYFKKSAVSLSAYEAARLAAVLPNPRRFNAAGDSRYVQKKADLIYRIMIRRGIVIPEYDEIMSQPDDMITEESEGMEDGTETDDIGTEENPEMPEEGDESGSNERVEPSVVPDLPEMTDPSPI